MENMIFVFVHALQIPDLWLRMRNKQNMKSAKRYAFSKNTHNISKLLQDHYLRLRCQYISKLQKRSTSAVVVVKHTHHIDVYSGP